MKMNSGKMLVSVTVDVENPQTPFFEKRFRDNRIWSGGYGIEKIIEILDKNNVKGTFFTNVYEYVIWGKREMERIVKYIHERGHDVELHTHPIWIDEKRRENMFQFSLEEQASIINFGADLIEGWTGRRPECHRAGAYGFNKQTLFACKKARISIDSSNFYGHPNCKYILTKNEITEWEGVIEAPVTFYYRGNQTIKTDIDWSSESELLKFAEEIRKNKNQNFINLFLHSYSLTRTVDNFRSFQPSEEKISKLSIVLSRLKAIDDISFIKLSELEKKRRNNNHFPLPINFRGTKGRKHIVFVKRFPQIRIYKQALGLARTGNYELTLVAERYDRNLFRGVFDKIVNYTLFNKHTISYKNHNGNINHQFSLDKLLLAQVIRDLKADIFHAHAEPNWVPRVVMENARVPVIYDTYDFTGVRFGVDGISRSEREAERFCLEKAYGIVNKFPDEVLNYYRSLGYKIEAPVLHYEDYCAEELMVSVDLNRSLPQEWHIVYAGNVAPASLPRERYGYVQFHDMARMLAEQRIYFHLYPNPYQYNSKLFDCYRELEKEAPRFHFHEPVAVRLLSKEICKYSWGALIHPPVASSLSELLWYGNGNKLVSYAEAGLPILINRDLLYGSKLVGENEIGYVFDFSEINNLGKILNDINWYNYRRNLETFRKKFSIGNQIERLIKFYQLVLTESR